MAEKMNYAQLDEAFNLWLVLNGRSKQEIKNYRSVLNIWRTAFEICKHHPVGKEFAGNFEKFCDDFARKQKEQNYQYATWSSRLSKIRKIRNFYLQQRDESPLPATLHERLSYFIEFRGYSMTSFTKAFGILPLDTLREWCSGARIPYKKNRKIVAEIEKFLKIPKEILSSKVKWISHNAVSVEETKFGKRLRINCKKPFYTWTTWLNEQFADWENFQTSIVPPAGMQRSKKSLWTSAEGAPRATAERVKANLKAFFGFCSLPTDASDPMLRGSGISKNDLSLSLLAECKLVEKYLLEFKPARSGGKFNHGYLTFIASVAAVLRPGTGYLYQQTEFAAELEISFEEWQEKCRRTRLRLLDIKYAIEDARLSGSSEFEMGRDPREPIAALLAQPQPLTATIQMIAKMLIDVEKSRLSEQARAYLYRDITLLALLQVNPLRARMYLIMKFDENLVREADGTWWLRFKRCDFKNRRSLSDDYNVRLASEVYPIIERYKKEFRPLFSHHATSQLVFLSGGKNPQCSSYALYNSVHSRTRQHIKDCPGFGLHSFRHLVATAIIKHHPETGFFLAAKVLHDKIETVEQNYAHLKTNDFIEPYNRLFSRIWRTAQLSEDEHDPDELSSESAGEEESE